MSTALRQLLLLLILSATLLSACGQKGPLYLPDDEQKKEQRR